MSAPLRWTVVMAALAVAPAACGDRSGLLVDDLPSNGADAGLPTVPNAEAGAVEDSGSTNDAGTDANACVGSLTDPLNCGTCGQDCLGGACIEGACQPVEIGATLTFLAIDAVNLYLNLGTTITKCALNSSCEQLTTISGCANARDCAGLAVGGTNVGFAAPDADGCTMEVAPIAGGAAAPLGTADCGGVVAMDAANAYWAYDGTLYQCAVGGCGGHPTALVTGQTILSIAVDARRVYWGGGRTVGAVPIGGGEAVMLAVGQHAVSGVAVDAANVYWANIGDDSGNGGVFQAPLGGGAVTMLMSSPWAPFQGSTVIRLVAVDATNVYWDGTLGSATGAPTLNSIPKGGGTQTFAEIGPPFAIGSTSVYGIGLVDGICTSLDDNGNCVNLGGLVPTGGLVRLAKPLRDQLYDGDGGP